MNARDNSINDSNFKKLLHNDNYYKHIFKKTEKIIAVVFYILNNIQIEKKSETLISNIASKAHFAHENALRSLEAKPISAQEVLEQFAQSLVGLDSSLRVASAANVITPEVLAVVTGEIDAVLRGLRAFLLPSTPSPEMLFAPSSYESGFAGDQGMTAAPFAARRSEAPRKPSAALQRAQAAPASPSDDRRQRIRTILEAKKEATIKDISEIITDCSEKTIQRELNAMIEENIVKRQGERRWSKYSMI